MTQKKPTAVAARYSENQLGVLQQISNNIDCECPNHLAGIVLSLQAFESYALACEDKNEADAHIHQMLYNETVRAREVMEEALMKLCMFEKIDVSNI